MSEKLNPVYIVGALRTPVARVGGSLASFDVHQLAGPLIAELLRRHGIEATRVDEVVLGNAAGPGGNPARVAALQAGLPVDIPAVTVDRQCGSGLEAVHYGARLLQSGAARIVVAGGAESASNAPLRVRPGERRFYQRASFTPQGMDDPDMGVAAENVAAEFSISRSQQDEFALSSHQKAVRAEAAGLFAAERFIPESLSPLPDKPVRQRGCPDECIREHCSLEALAQLPAVFKTGGSVTAGNACPVNDGAAMLLMTNEPPSGRALKFIDAVAAGVEPRLLGTGPIPATRKLLERTAIAIESIDAIEFNEAFAAQVLASAGALNMPMQRVNQRGGALAIGHPYGASGAMLVTRLLHQLESGQTGLATIGIGGGMGLSALFKSV